MIAFSMGLRILRLSPCEIKFSWWVGSLAAGHGLVGALAAVQRLEIVAELVRVRGREGRRRRHQVHVDRPEHDHL